MINVAYWTEHLDLLLSGSRQTCISEFFSTWTVIGSIDALQGMIAETERQHIREARPKRKKEFIAGRNAAHLALNELGCPARSIERDHQRAPVWPRGVTGSISHDDVLAGAIVGYTTRISSIGIDIESSVPLRRDLHDLVLTSCEMNMTPSPEYNSLDDFAKVAFSAKESLFKADWQLHREALDFHQVEISKLESGNLLGHVKSDRRGNPDRFYHVSLVRSAAVIMTVSVPVFGFSVVS